MAKITCRLIVTHVPEHLYQILAGFELLARQGLVDLSVEFPRAAAVRPNMLEVVVNGRTRVLYDVNDGYDNFLAEGQSCARYYDALLDGCDAMFKRSYSRPRNRALANARKMHPLGLNYMVTVPGSLAHHPWRGRTPKERLARLARMVPFYKLYNGHFSVGAFEDVPRREPSPGVLFIARLWDLDEPGLPAAKREERAAINDFRARCVRLCRQAFGARFLGGLIDTPLARSRCPDLVLDDPRVTRRDGFLRAVQASSVCVATTGLHQSIGWKLAEYVAASKAIVSEALHYEVPGEFREGRNYREFLDPEACVARIEALLDDADARYQMMVENYRYYQQHVRPDRLVLNSLLTALQA